MELSLVDGPLCDGCHAPLVDLAVWNERGRFCSDCYDVGLEVVMVKRATPATRMPENFLTVEDVMRRTKFGRHKVYDLIRRGVIPSKKEGKYRRIPESALEEYMRLGAA